MQHKTLFVDTVECGHQLSVNNEHKHVYITNTIIYFFFFFQVFQVHHLSFVNLVSHFLCLGQCELHFLPPAQTESQPQRCTNNKIYFLDLQTIDNKVSLLISILKLFKQRVHSILSDLQFCV